MISFKEVILGSVLGLSACGHGDLTKRVILLEERTKTNENSAETVVLYRNREALQRHAEQYGEPSSFDVDSFQYHQEDPVFFRNLKNLKGWSAYTLDQLTDEFVGGGDDGSD